MVEHTWSTGDSRVYSTSSRAWRCGYAAGVCGFVLFEQTRVAVFDNFWFSACSIGSSGAGCLVGSDICIWREHERVPGLKI